VAAYTFPPAPVLIETTGAFAIGAAGVMRPTTGGDPVPLYDLNDLPLASILVGPKGAHQAFKADIPDGVLDFGSVLLPASSLEQQRAALNAVEVAASASSAANTALAAASAAQAAVADASRFTVSSVEAASSVNPIGTWDFDIAPTVNGSALGGGSNVTTSTLIARVLHNGTTSGGTRPTGYAAVLWFSPPGSNHTRPTNMVNNVDIWMRPA
jgi:hypothetical protein